jgi:uncharacterized protein
MGFVQRQLVKVVIRVVSYPWTTVGICAALLVAAVGWSWFGLSLSTDQNELLTPKLKFFRDYQEFDRRFPENEAFVVLVEARDYSHPPEPKRWMALADATSAKLLTLKRFVKRVDTHVPLDELSDQALLFGSWQDVRDASEGMQRMLPLLKILGEKPGLDSVVLGRNVTQRFYSALSQGPAADGKQFVTVITRSLNAALEQPPEKWKKGEEIPELKNLEEHLDPSRYGYYMIDDETKRDDPARRHEQILVINVYNERDFGSLSDVTEPLQQMRAAVAEVAALYPEFHVGLTGRPALEADEMRTSHYDTRLAEICGLSLVFVALWIFLRNLWLVIVAEVCLGVGIGWTFGWATLAVGRLNLLSLVFVIALIGIGMDYLIQILTRYRFEKRRYIRPQAIWARVFRYVSPPISTACLGAAGAFLVANLTDFSGAAELGLIAGGGLLLCLAAGYTLLPALLTIFPANVGKVAEEDRYHDPAKAARGGGWRLAVAALWVIIALAGAWYAGSPKFDPNLLKLQAVGLESVQLVHKLPTWSGAVMTENLAELKAARAALTPAAGEKESKILTTDSVLDAMDKQKWLADHNQALKQIKWQEPALPEQADVLGIADAAENVVIAWEKQQLPGVDLTELRRDIKSLANRLRNPADREAALTRLAAWQKAFYDELRSNVAQLTPPQLDLSRLPPQIRDHYVSYDAKNIPTYAMYVFPRQDLWKEGELEPFVRELEERIARMNLPGTTLTGIAVQLLYSTHEIHHAFLMSTLYALVLIFVLVLLDLRRPAQTFLAISVLGLGLPMLVLMMWVWRSVPIFHQQTFEQLTGIPGSWNFANFFGLPILIGAGHEYGVFMVHRYRETLHDPRRVWRPWDVSDRALLLCAIVTSCSFGFLMMAQHRGLASLGWVMAVGSACIYLATLLVLRPILQWRLQHRQVYAQIK